MNITKEKWVDRGVVLSPKEDWEGPAVASFTCNVETLPDGELRFWYYADFQTGHRRLGVAEGTFENGFKHYPVAVSSGPAKKDESRYTLDNLPDGWMIGQEVSLPMGDGTYRLYFWAHAPGVVRYLAADSQDGFHYTVIDPYKPVLYHPNDRAVEANTIPAGLTPWGKPNTKRLQNETQADPDQVSNDATQVYRLPDGTFEMYSVGLLPIEKDDPRYMPHDNAAGVIRVIDRYISRDGLRFKQQKSILTPDEKDPVDLQFYYLSVTHTPQGRVGLLGHYRVEAQTMDIEWCFSEDGIHWQRGRNPWLPRENSLDGCYMVHASNHMFMKDGLWHLLYDASNFTHNSQKKSGPKKIEIRLATIPQLVEM